MKKKFTILKFALLVTITTNAQNWLITGNKGINPSQNFLGTIDSKALVFRTHNIERMRITLNGNVGIATLSPRQKLDVHGNINIDSNLYIANTKILSYQNYGLHVGAADGTVFIGDHQTATGLYASSSDNGITGVALGGIGVYGFTEEINPMYFTAGLYGRAYGGKGVIGESDSSYGIYGSTNNPASYAGYFKGSLYASGIFIPSDKKLKQNIQNFSDAINIIKQLHPKEYQYRQDNNDNEINLPKGEHYGLLAEDVEQVLPNLVKESKFEVGTTTTGKISFPKPNLQLKNEAGKTSKVANFKALNYTEFIPILIKGIQEQQSMLEVQQQSIEELKKLSQQQQQEIAQLQSALKINFRQNDESILPTSISVIVKQNFPNPFSGSTIINYNIPYKYSSARLDVSDKNGNTLKQINLNQTGKGNVKIDAAGFASGTYQYSLYIDGRLVGTRQMVIEK
jgi:hypothetical protein